LDFGFWIVKSGNKIQAQRNSFERKYGKNKTVSSETYR
jgi:hypothetical protein